MINSYAEEKWKVKKPVKRQLVFATWKLVQNSGILRYLAIVAGMALQPKPKVRDYWSRLDFYHILLCQGYAERMIRRNSVTCFRRQWKKGKRKDWTLSKSATILLVMRIIFLLILEAKQHPRMKGALNVRKIFQAFLSPLGKRHCVYANWYYTTYQLLEYMTDKEFEYTARIHCKQIGKNFPKEIKNSKILFQIFHSWKRLYLCNVEIQESKETSDSSIIRTF